MDESEQRLNATRELTEWAYTTRDRDPRIRRAFKAGLGKSDIHNLTGIARTTIDRVLEPRVPDEPATWKLPFAVTASFVGTNNSSYAVDADDRAEAEQLLAAALAAGYHHASIKQFVPGALHRYQVVYEQTRDSARRFDHIIGRTDAGAEVAGVVEEVDGEHYLLRDGQRVTFVQFDPDALAGYHYDPAYLDPRSSVNQSYPDDVEVVTVANDGQETVRHRRPAIVADYLHGNGTTTPSCGEDDFYPAMYWYRDDPLLPRWRVDRGPSVSDDAWCQVWLIMTNQVLP
jgi:hypothetical protein